MLMRNPIKTAIFLVLASLAVMLRDGLYTHKLQIADMIFLIIFVPIIMKFIKDRKEVYLSPFIKPVAAYVTMAAVSIFISISPMTTVIEFAGICYLALIFLLWINIVDTEELLRYAVWCWVVISTVISLIGLYGIILSYGFDINNPFVVLYAKHPYINHLYRVNSTFFQNEKFFSSYLLISIPLTLSLAFYEKRRNVKFFLFAAVLLFLINVFFTYSRSLVGILIAIYIVLFRVYKKLALSKGAIVKALKVVGATSIVILWVATIVFSYIQLLDVSCKTQKMHSLPENMQEPFYYRSDIGIERTDVTLFYNYTYYLLLKKIAVDIFIEHPILGVGNGAFIDKTKLWGEEGRLPKDYFVYDPHSTFFGSLAEGGMIGFGVLIFLWSTIITTVRKSITSHREDFVFYVTVAFYAAIVGFFVQATDIDVMNFRFLWILFAFSAIALRLAKNKKPHSI